MKPGIKRIGHCKSCVYANDLFLHNFLFGHLHTTAEVSAGCCECKG